MATQKFMGKNQLIDRLAAQVGSKELALSILQKRGHVDDKGELTKTGQKRDNMTAGERAIDRTQKREGGKPADFKYNPATNRAVRR